VNDVTKDLTILGIDGDTYQKLLAIAKKQNRSVVEVVSEALGKHINENQALGESKTAPKLLMEG